MFIVTRTQLQQRAARFLSLRGYGRRTRRQFNEFLCRRHDDVVAGSSSICDGHVQVSLQPFSYLTVSSSTVTSTNKNAPIWIQRRWFSTTLTEPNNLLDGNSINKDNQQPKQPPQQFDAVDSRSSISHEAELFRDPWVSIWQKKDDRIYLLGSKHSSARSMELAEALVQQTRPQIVFVELCQDEWLTALIQYIQNQLNLSSSQQLGQHAASLDDDDDNDNSAILTLWYVKETRPLWRRIFMDPPDKWLPTKFVSQTHQLYPSAKASAGFASIPNNEFFTAAWQGQRYHHHQQHDHNNNDVNNDNVKNKPAVIVLGDCSDWLTQSRYHWYNLISIFSFVGHWYAILGQLPKLMEDFSHLHQSIDGDDDDIGDTREKIRRAGEIIQQVVPLYYRMLVQERNAYMAAGLEAVARLYHHKQQQSLQQPSATTIVAVVGKSHMDGVEECLQKFGWDPVVISAIGETETNHPTNQPMLRYQQQQIHQKTEKTQK